MKKGSYSKKCCVNVYRWYEEQGRNLDYYILKDISSKDSLGLYAKWNIKHVLGDNRAGNDNNTKFGIEFLGMAKTKIHINVIEHNLKTQLDFTNIQKNLLQN